MKKNIIYIITSLVALLLIIGFYFVFFSTNTMNYSIILDKKQTKDQTTIKVYQGGETKTLNLKSSLDFAAAPAYNIKTKRKEIVSIEPVKYYSGKILSLDASSIHLADKTLRTTSSTKYYKVDGTSLSEISSKGLIVGYQGYRYIMDKDNNVKIVLCSIPSLNRIRTLISNSDFSTTNHKEIRFTFNSEAELKAKDLNHKFIPNDILTVSKEASNMKLSLVTASGTTSTKISIPSNIRTSGYIPSYSGSLELTVNDKGIKLINETYLEEYLKGTVPSEMPSFGGIEGYKIQSVVSRTNALFSILSKENASLGVHVLDSNCSLYEASLTNKQSNDAVEFTKGEIININGEIIDAKFYSTSPGFGASYVDVFGKTVPTRDYLKHITFSNLSESIDYSNEDEITSYLKDWTVSSYDSNSPLFRWKYSIDYSNLSKIINTNIKTLYKDNPDNIKEKWHFFIYNNFKMPSDGIGRVSDIRITKRTPSGTVEQITIESEKGIYKVSGVDYLRKLFIPKEGIELTPIHGKPLQEIKTLPSPFYTMEKNMSGDKFKSLTIYGGGDGHGVGLSKHGAIGLSRQGKSYKDIIKTYYPETEIINITKDYRLEVENRK
ncbi:MAG: SpoIID/LytB domain-containing protein [Clostridium sp.]